MNSPVKPSKSDPRVLNLRLVRYDEMAQYDDFMDQYHRRGALRRIGHELHYVVEDRGQWIALISFSPAALKCSARDQWIGLISQIQNDRLRFIVNNSRFLILPGHAAPNLGSRILSACRKRLASDWMRHFSQPLLLLETFVDTDFHTGTIYRADNWVLAGKTRGYRRVHGGYSPTPTESVKLVFVKPLHADAQAILRAQPLPDVDQYRVKKMNLAIEDYGSLYDYFQGMKDVRSRQGRRHELASVLSLIAAAMFSGAIGYKGIWIWCDELSQANRRHFHCRRWRGKRITPSITCIRNTMIQVNPDRLQQLVNRFSIQHFGLPFEPLAIDGKVLCGSKGEHHRQTQVMNVVGHDSGFCYAKKK